MQKKSKETTRIIVIEDDLTLGSNLEEELSVLGYEVIGPYTESTKAMQAFNKYNPHLAVVDIGLKNSPMDGIELVKAFKQKQDVPIVFLSGKCDQETRKRARKVGPNYFLSKPASLRQLDIAIDLALYNFMKSDEQHFDFNDFHSTQNFPGYIFIKHNGRYIRINPFHIFHIKAAGSQAEIYLQHSKYLVSTHLSDLLKQIGIEKLIKCHRSYAINLDTIIGFDHHTIYVNFQNQVKEIPIGEKYRKGVLSKIKFIKSK